MVLNSEEHPWLKSFKPDFVILPNAYWKSCQRTMTSEAYQNGKFGIVPHEKIYDTIRCVIDAKIADKDSKKPFAFADSDRGQLKDYAVRILHHVWNIPKLHGKVSVPHMSSNQGCC